MKIIHYTKRIFLIGALFFLLIAAGTQMADTKNPNLITVNIDEFVHAWKNRPTKDQAIILDVRTPSEYKGGHAPKSVNIDYYAEDFRQDLDQLDKGKTYFMYCRSGSRSSRTLKIMGSLGFKKVYNLDGGWLQYHLILSALDN